MGSNRQFWTFKFYMNYKRKQERKSWGAEKTRWGEFESDLGAFWSWNLKI
jgi:hypothetical protein